MKYMFCLRAAVFAALFSVILGGCISDDGPTEGGYPVAGTAVEFPTTISKTRAFDDKWEYGDDIGVFMIPAANQTRRSWGTIELYAANKRYVHDMDENDEPDDRVVFSGFDKANTIVWPGDKRKFDVVAYYPWTASISDENLYTVTLSDQSSQKAIDLMWSDNVRGQSSGAPTLGFVHKLAKLVFNVTDTTGASLGEMTSTFDGLPTTASFDLASGEIADGTEGGFEPFEGYLHSTDDGDGSDGAERAIVEAIVLPGSLPEGYTVTFSLAGGEQALFAVTEALFEAGKRYIYNVSLTPSTREGASFGVDGALEQIARWGDGEVGSYPGEIPKTGPGSADGLSSAWEWVEGVQFGSDIAVTGMAIWASGFYKISGQVDIKKTDCEGIASVTVRLTNTGNQTTIGPVRVGDHALVIDHDGSPGTPAVESYPIPATSQATDFVFRTGDGQPRSGDVTIRIVVNGSGSANIHGLGTNTDITKNNP